MQQPVRDPHILRTCLTYELGYKPMPYGWSEQLANVSGSMVSVYRYNNGIGTRIHPRVFRTFDELARLTLQELLTIQLWEVYPKTATATLSVPFPTDSKSKIIKLLIEASRDSFNIIEDFTNGWGREQKISRLFPIKNRYIAARNEELFPTAPTGTGLNQINPPKGGNRRLRKNKKTGKKTSSKRGRYKKTKKNNRRRK